MEQNSGIDQDPPRVVESIEEEEEEEEEDDEDEEEEEEEECLFRDILDF